MTCRNCYIPNRTVPDLDYSWLAGILSRLPRHTKVRFAGAEPTLREDLCDLIRLARQFRLHPALMTNGLKLAAREYVRALKRAGLRVIYLSFNGGFDPEAYRRIDGSFDCAAKKLQALDNLCSESIYVSLGMILVPGINEDHPRAVLDFCRRHRQVREFHIRGVARMGRYMKNRSFNLQQLMAIFARNADLNVDAILAGRPLENPFDFHWSKRLTVHLTEWPDLGSRWRGRLTPEGMIEPSFEHILANEGGY
jgi:molybdenum cofactor biosynthesis enzyme MoaA